MKMNMIKKFLLSISIVAALLGAPALSYAQSSRVGVVNTERILNESDLGKASAQRLEQEFSAEQRRIEEQEQRFQGMVESYQRDLPTLSESARTTRLTQLQQEEQNVLRARSDFQRNLNNRRNQELQVLLERANAAIRQVATNERFDLILTEAVFVKPELDITDRVLTILNSSR